MTSCVRILRPSIDAADTQLSGAMHCPDGLTCNIVLSHYNNDAATRKGTLTLLPATAKNFDLQASVYMCPSHLPYGEQY